MSLNCGFLVVGLGCVFLLYVAPFKEDCFVCVGESTGVLNVHSKEKKSKKSLQIALLHRIIASEFILYHPWKGRMKLTL